jgi:SAM-dependent methyltransferase
MMKLKTYTSYDDYLKHQREKTRKTRDRESRNYAANIERFTGVFNWWFDQFHISPSRAVCIGARSGAEVEALRNMGVDAVGYDLVESPPLVLLGDAHELPCPDVHYDFVFTNVFDHSAKPQAFAAEVERVCKPGGNILMQLEIGLSDDSYRANDVTALSDVLMLFESRLIFTRPISWRGSINTEALLCK